MPTCNVSFFQGSSSDFDATAVYALVASVSFLLFVPDPLRDTHILRRTRSHRPGGTTEQSSEILLFLLGASLRRNVPEIAARLIKANDAQFVQLRLRKMVFSNSIKFTAPPEAFKEMVTVETIDGKASDGTSQQWTRITVRDHIRDQS